MSIGISIKQLPYKLKHINCLVCFDLVNKEIRLYPASFWGMHCFACCSILLMKSLAFKEICFNENVIVLKNTHLLLTAVLSYRLHPNSSPSVHTLILASQVTALQLFWFDAFWLKKKNIYVPSSLLPGKRHGSYNRRIIFKGKLWHSLY